MYSDMTAVTMKSNKTVLNEVKDNLVLLEPSYRKNQNGLIGQLNIIAFKEFLAIHSQLAFAKCN